MIRARHSWMGPVFGGHDPGVCARQMHAQALCLSGFIAAGKECVEQAIFLGEKLKHPHSLVFALANGMVFQQLAGDYETLDRLAQRVIELSDRYNFPPQRAQALLISGWARAVGSNSDAGLELMEAEFPRAIVGGPLFRYFGALLAEARAKFGRLPDALTVLRWALDSITEPGIAFYLPELYRLQGVCLLRLDSHKKEEAMISLANGRGHRKAAKGSHSFNSKLQSTWQRRRVRWVSRNEVCNPCAICAPIFRRGSTPRSLLNLNDSCRDNVSIRASAEAITRVVMKIRIKYHNSLAGLLRFTNRPGTSWLLTRQVVFQNVCE